METLNAKNAIVKDLVITESLVTYDNAVEFTGYR